MGKKQRRGESGAADCDGDESDNLLGNIWHALIGRGVGGLFVACKVAYLGHTEQGRNAEPAGKANDHHLDDVVEAALACGRRETEILRLAEHHMETAKERRKCDDDGDDFDVGGDCEIYLL